MRDFLQSKLFFALLLPFAAAACGGGGGGGTAGSGGAAGSAGMAGSGGAAGSAGMAGSGGTAGSGGAPMDCKGPGFGGSDPTVNIGTLQASLVDQDGKPAANVPVFVCGTDICTDPATTNGSGAASIPVNKGIKAPAFKYGDGLGFAKFAAPLAAGDAMFDKALSLTLPAVGTGDALTPGKSAKSNGVIIDVPAGGSVEIDVLLYEDPSQATFRALLAPGVADLPSVDPTLNLEIVYGAAPVETVFCPPAKLHVPNTPKWAAGTAVEFYVHGLDVGQHWAPYGGWAKVSDGAVSADGMEIVTADDQGLPVLATFGVALKK